MNQEQRIDPGTWNERVLSSPDGSFLQSFEWGEFQEALGHRVVRSALPSGGLLQAVATALPFGWSYLTVSRGPVGERAETKELRAWAVEAGRQAGALFVRVEPSWSPERARELAAHGFVRTIPTQPETTWVVDLASAEEELLAAMHPKTRYNIRLAERRGVRIVEAGREAYQNFWGLLQQTAARESFRMHPKQYHDLMAERFLVPELVAPFLNPQARLFIAEYQSEPLAPYTSLRDSTGFAAAFVMFFGGEAMYLYGGSSGTHRELMAPHLLHWEIMRRAKTLGCVRYNFWGVAPQVGATPWQREQQKAWAGFTRFKQSFGGHAIEYAGAWDLVLRPHLYRLYALARSIRRGTINLL